MKDWFYLSRHTECLRNIRLNLEGYLNGTEEMKESTAEYLLMLVNILLRVSPPLPSDKMYDRPTRV